MTHAASVTISVYRFYKSALRLFDTDFRHDAQFRGNDGDGGEIVIAAILSFRSKSKLSKQEIKQEIVRKARYALKRAAVAT